MWCVWVVYTLMPFHMCVFAAPLKFFHQRFSLALSPAAYKNRSHRLSVSARKPRWSHRLSIKAFHAPSASAVAWAHLYLRISTRRVACACGTSRARVRFACIFTCPISRTCVRCCASLVQGKITSFPSSLHFFRKNKLIIVRRQLI